MVPSANGGFMAAKLKRTTIYLANEQLKRMAKGIAKEPGVKIAELIRRYINEGLKRDELSAG
jgi:hypothetical protein